MGARTPPSLTDRERAVLALLAEGYGYEQIAMRLEIALGTVRTYVVRMYRKLGVNTKSEAAALAVRVGILR
ncbi:MAG: helix-turn-helix transcriptional regulator [Polyangiales bacterium]